MAVPRVFISSTYYDLKEVRNNVGNFIINLGYDPVMHERSGVAYVQDKPLEDDCYHELASCDIVVCIIGSKFGSQSSNNNLSITMNEIERALKSKKKVYIFIARDLYVENRTYEQNKDSGCFKSAYTEDLRVHDFILKLRNDVKVHVVTHFDTTDDIVFTLKSQFAGLFQSLLSREASKSESAVIADLSDTATLVWDAVDELRQEKEAFFKKFESTVFGRNYTLRAIEEFLGLDKASIFARNIDALDELMNAFGFNCVSVDNRQEDARKYTLGNGFFGNTKIMVLKKALLNDDGTFKDIRQNSFLNDNLIRSEIPDDDAQLPF